MSRNVETLSARADAAGRDLRDVANGALGHAEEAASEAVHRARRLSEDAAHAAHEAKQRLAEAYDRAGDGAQRAYRGARTYAKRNPAITAALAFSTGLGVGLMLAPRRTSNTLRGQRRGLMPIAAIALAHALLEAFNKER